MSFTTCSDSQASVDNSLKNLDTLKEDISSALDRLGLERLPERFYHHLNDATAPNPGLEVAGAGLIRLPLSCHDAEALVNIATAPGADCGQYELDSNLVSFRNPKWSAYVAANLLQMVAQVFMLPNYASEKAGLRLDKVIVCLNRPEGSWSPPATQVTPNATTFAHVLVILPSQFERGRMTFMAGNDECDMIDVSSDAEFNTPILTWHSGVTCAFEPLASGYRLALEYSLEIENLPSICHLLPSPARALKLRESVHAVLLGWKTGEYRVPYPPMIVHPEATADSGLRSVLLPVARQLGFIVCKARAEMQREGEGDDSQDDYDRRRRHAGFSSSFDDWEEEGFAPPMGGTFSTKILVGMGECLGDEDGLSLLGGLSLVIDEACLTPSVFDEEGEPDKAEYYGFAHRMGPGHLKQLFYTNSLVILQKKDAIPLAVGGQTIQWATQQIQRLPRTPPTAQTQALVAAVVDKLTSVDNQNREARSSHSKTTDISGTAKAIMRCALSWNDPDLWGRGLPLSGLSAHDIGRASSAALSRLHIDFSCIQPGVEAAVEHATDPVQRLKILNSLYDNLAQDLPRAWFKEHTTSQLCQYNRLQDSDIPTIMETAIRFGLKSLGKILIPSLLLQDDAFNFLIALLKAIRGVRDLVPQHLGEQYADVVRTCFMAAAEQWGNVLEESNAHPYGNKHRQPPNTHRPAAVKVGRICYLVKAALSKKDLTPLLGPLLELVLPSAEGDFRDLQTAFRDLYTPLIPRLKQTTAQFSLTVSSPPFDAFLHNLIQIYLDHILMSQDTATPLITPSILCGCLDCAVLCDFLKGSKPKISFKVSAERRGHLEMIAMSPGAREMVTTATIVGSTPYTLAITKTKELMERVTWDGRKAAARAFLGMIGDDSVLLATMGKPMFERVRRDLSLTLEHA